MNTPGRRLLIESLHELRAAIGEVRAEIEEVEGSPRASAVRERLNLLLEAEQQLHTKIEVLDSRVTPYCNMEMDAEAEDCGQWLAVARQARAQTREERLSVKTKTDRTDQRVGRSKICHSPRRTTQKTTLSARQKTTARSDSRVRAM